MTKETKHRLKKKIKMLTFKDAMEQSATNIAAMGVKPMDGVAPNSWEGMMQMLAKVERFGSPDEKAAATLAAAAWVWGHKEKCLYKKICEIIDVIDEAKSDEYGEGEHNETPHDGEDAPHDPEAATTETTVKM